MYLSDVSLHDATDMRTVFRWERALTNGRWFKRGWTLQELTAPTSVAFFSKERSMIGNKNNDLFVGVLANVTRIPTPALRGVKLSRFDAQTRLSWAAGRETTIPEDCAYCLAGLVDVQLPLLYADGEYEKRRRIAMAELQQID